MKRHIFTWLAVFLLVLWVRAVCTGADTQVTGSATAWGTPVDGLQAGLAFAKVNKPCRIGSSIILLIVVRNVSDQPVQLEYTEPPLNTWAPDIRDHVARRVPVMPPILPPVGRLMRPSLPPGETITLGPETLSIRPLGWEAKVTETVAFADVGVHRVTHTVKFGPHPNHPKLKPWTGELTTGELELEIVHGSNEVKFNDHRTNATKEETQTVLHLLGDYERNQLRAMRACCAGSDDWQRSRNTWTSRCASLTRGEFDYLGHVAIQHGDDGYRAVACDALDETNRNEAAFILRKCLKDKSSQVRRTAARSLGHLRQEANVPDLLKLLSDADAGVRTGAVYALGHSGSDLATQELLRVLRTDDNTGVKQAAALALGWITDPAALPGLKEALTEAKETLHDYVKAAIRNIEDPNYWGLGVKRGIAQRASGTE